MSQAKTIRVYLKQDPSVYVIVKTTEDRVRAKLKSIRRDMYQQTYPRWAPFRDQPEAHSGRDTGWCWEFVE